MFKHYSVLLDESVNGLNIKENGIYVDCTLGGAGHSIEILKRLKNGKLFAFDQDSTAIENAYIKLEKYKENVTLIKSNFKNIKKELEKLDVKKVDGIIYDLGVSSPQLDVADRGFSYRYDGKLDMRMDQENTLTAYNVVNDYSYNDLVNIFYKYGEEKFAKKIARNIEKERELKPVETTLELVEIIKKSLPQSVKRKSKHPAKKVFQAIRIEVNDELKSFQQSLEQAIEMLNVGGRISVITFHSLEDRICKQTFNLYSKPKDIPKNIPILPGEIKLELKNITRKPILPKEEELEENSRSRSAKLRIAEKQI